MAFNEEKNPLLNNLGKKIGLGVAAVAGAISLFGSFTVLEETERGLDYRVGKMTTKDASELRGQGLTFKVPFMTSVKKINVSQRQLDLKDVQTYTKDNQVITAVLAVFYKIPLDQVVPLYKNNPNFESQLEKTVLDAVKSSLGQQEAQNVAQNRDAIMVGVTKEAQIQVKKVLGIDVISIKMPNFDFDDAFETAVAKAANAKAVLNEKKTELEQSRIDAQKSIVVAEAQAEAAKKTADGKAYSVRTELEAKATGQLALAEAQAKGFNKIAAAIGTENIQTYLNSEAWKAGGSKMPETLVTGGNATTLVGPAIKAATAAAAKQ